MAKTDKTLSAAEKQAVKDRAKELRASQKKEKLEQAVLEKIAEMTEDEQAVARRVHAMVKELAPDLTAKTMYGMPAYADADGRTVLMFQAASKFGTRYSTITFDEGADLDDGTMWPISWALTTITDAEKLRELVARAVG
ncbi:MAG: hypothetical protein DCC50_13145 [Acidobacteria bacterium]|nr:MAG: hypothetical protein DCC50_13145 [Acidobacteriota bacterium]